MKQLKKISLSQISKKEIEKRELNQLLGGVNCCICGCESSNVVASGNSNYANDENTEAGYGSGAFSGK